MKWILCYLNPSDYINFFTDISDSSETLEYQEFIGFVNPHLGGDYKEFLENLNRYLTIFIDVENRSWRVYHQEHKEATFDELFDLNQQREERKRHEKLGDDIAIYKKTIENIFNNKYDKQNRNKGSGGESVRSFFSRSRKK